MTPSRRVLIARRALFAALAAFLLLGSPFVRNSRAGAPGSTEDDEQTDLKRARIDQKTREALDRLLGESEEAKRLDERAYGYAVFSDAKVTLGLSGSGGIGEAVVKGKAAEDRVYMRMAGVGAAIGLGAQKYTVVFFFEDQVTFDDFVNKGWKAEGSASAALGMKGANAEAHFTNGLAIFTLTEGGAMLQADISGTRYWKSEKLNKGLDKG